jgi:predicted nucleic acid-binding protein
MILVDTSVLFDILNDDPNWADWSQAALESALGSGSVIINDIIYAELSVRFDSVEHVEAAVAGLSLQHATIPKPALLLAGKAFQRYRARGGTKNGVLSDFFIGAHAAVEGWPLLTRDPTRVRSHFPTIELIAP